MENKLIYSLKHNLFTLFILIISLIICQINDNYQRYFLENGTYDLLDISDNYNLNLIISTSKKIYAGIPPILKVTTEAQLINSTSLITLNENYLLAACLKDSLLTKINLVDGSYSNLIGYSEIDNSLNLDIPITSCSLSIYENIIFIGYSRINYYEVINGNDTEIISNKTNIIIKLNIDNIQSNFNIINKNFFIFPISTTLTPSPRQISCQPLKILNEENDYRLVCIYETLQYAEDYGMERYYIYANSINENIDGFENNMDENRIYRTNDYSGFKLYKLNDYYAGCLTKKGLYELHLELIDGKAKIFSFGANKNLSSISASPDLFDYNNNFIFFSENKNPYYFRINKGTSSNYFMVYDYYEKTSIKNLIGYYDNTNDYTIVVFQNNQDNYIKYFTLKNNENIYNIGSYKGIIRIKTNETVLYNLYNLFNFSEFGTIEINKIITYGSDSSSSKSYVKDNSYLIRDNNNITITNDLSLNYWYEYSFLLIENVNKDYKKLFYLNDITLTIRTCAYQCGSCSEDYYKCDDCRNNNYILFNLEDGNENNCYPVTQLYKGYIYNSTINSFQQCYSSCDFCSESSDNVEFHNCESCTEGYFPSYNNLGNCYKSDDENFITESCTKYKIHSTGECIEECPISTPYYSFEYNYINLTEQINELSIQQYTKSNIIPPKYLFNNICYDTCPLYSIPNNENNICECEFAFHKEENNNEIICHPGLYCISDNNKYRYYIEDTKECITNGCPTNYYQFNFLCYKDACPDNTEEIESYKCISLYNFCYINENFENVCNENQEEGYMYKFDNTSQYLKNCDESVIYTTNSAKSYLFNNICYLTCPENTKTNDEQNKCICKAYGYYPENEDIICYSEYEKCGSDKIPIIDLKVCLNTIDECHNNNYKIFNNECYSKECPENTNEDISSGDNNCICSNLFYNDTNNNILICFEESITECPNESYEFYNPDTKECLISLDDCFNKGNNFFFNKNCYKNGCPNDTILLSEQNNEIQNYFKNNLLASNDDLINKLCICDINNKNWSNQTSDNLLFFQKCLNQCDEGFGPEPITNQCLEIIPTTVITTQFITTTISTTTPQPITTESITTISKIITTEPITTIPKIITTEPSSTKQIIKENKELKIIYPDEYYSNIENCKAIYENKCYPYCPDGTCLTQQDPSLISCVQIDPKVKVFNNICFENFDELTKNIKSMSENDNIISSESGIIIHGYSTNNDNNVNIEANYSIVYLGECENKIREYYHLEEDTELFILGIDSPNKNESYTTSVYNYGVYLGNGTLLDHSMACKDIKISVSSVITNPDLIKLDDAYYFNNLGYDIYNESSSFYTDNCAPASIDGNDITLEDRKKDFYPSNASLCNESCSYANIDLEAKRFICECDTNYNSSENNKDEENIEEDDTSYFAYFLSLINYKIAICYELFYDFQSYYYNAGFYIAIGTFLFCFGGMIIFLTSGLRVINKIIKNNIPNKGKLKDVLKEKNEKIKEYTEIKNKGNPLKKKSKKEFYSKDSEKILKTQNKINKNKIKDKNKLKTENEFFKSKKSKKLITDNASCKFQKKSKNLMAMENSKNKLKINKKVSLKEKSNKRINFLFETESKHMLKIGKRNKISNKNNLIDTNSNYKNNKRKIIKDQYGLISYISDQQVDKKELNIIPYTQALRIDKRNFIEIFLSVLFHEIEIIDIFYYKSPFNHLSLILSIYVFELCLDLTLNCLLYTDDVVSEKYNNNGSIEFLTSLSLSFMSNIFAGIIAFIVSKLVGYDAVLEMIIKSVIKQKEYFINIIKFKKYLTLKLTGFFIIQMLINLGMCYYLMIFCTIYHNTQGSILVNYIVGIAESMLISLALTIFTSLIRYFSLKYKWRSLYYTSRYFFENF